MSRFNTISKQASGTQAHLSEVPTHLITRIERLPDVIARTGMGRSWIYDAVQRGVFPKPVKLSARAVGWRSNDIDAWLASRAA